MPAIHARRIACRSAIAAGLLAASACAHALAPEAIVITELMINPLGSSDAGREWFEIRSSAAIDLRGLRVERGNGDFFVVGGADPVVIGADQYFVLAQSADPAHNGGLPVVDYAYGDAFQLINSNESLRLIWDGVQIDQVDILSAASGRSYEVDASRGLHLSSQVLTYDPAGDTGTPGAANDVMRIPVAAVPEPSAVVLVLAGLAAIVGFARRGRAR